MAIEKTLAVQPRILVPVLICAFSMPAWADLSALVVMEPTSRKDVLMLSRR